MSRSALNIVLFALLSLTQGPLLCSAQKAPSGKGAVHRLRIAELNCENLFDTIHTEGHNDQEFLPASKRGWNSRRYRRKLSMLAREIASVSQTEPADLVALVEVEGDTALHDLTRRTRLRALHYQYLVTSGSDQRGINVALLYREGSFRPLHTRSICWQERLADAPPTRDVLHAHGITRSGDTLDIFVCHLPSQYGKLHSQHLRSDIAAALRVYIDSLTEADPRANVIIIGDMNDRPESRPLQLALGATVLKVARPQAREESAGTLYNISNLRANRRRPRGTYRYQGQWTMLDQCIVNSRLLDNSNHLHLARKGPVRIISHAFLMEEDRQYGGQKPWRTYQGPLYRGGFSDHLPIVVEFEYRH